MWDGSARWDAGSGAETGSVRRLVQAGQREGRIGFRYGVERRSEDIDIEAEERDGPREERAPEH
jgi:hypothetical protein